MMGLDMFALGIIVLVSLTELLVYGPRGTAHDEGRHPRFSGWPAGAPLDE
jgi:hypothetical protein